MIEFLDRQQALTGRQRRLVITTIIAQMLEFFDFFLIGFVLVFIIGPWGLTYGESAVILLSSGIGALLGSIISGALADVIGRRKIFICTIITFSLSTGVLIFTPTGNWLFLSAFRVLIGLGVGGLYTVGLPLVQEFVPTNKRGLISGIVTSFIPIGTLLGSVSAAFLTPFIGWRGLFAVGLLPIFLVLPVYFWIPESPHWLVNKGRIAEARKSLAWALEVDPEQIVLPARRDLTSSTSVSWLDLFHYPRSLLVSGLANLGIQTGLTGLVLWAPTLLSLLLHISAARAASLMIFVTLGGLVGRFAFSWLSEKIGRRASGGLLGFGAAVFLMLAALLHSVFLGSISLFWLLLIVGYFFVDGGWAVVGPYAAEIWPSRLRASGMGATYGFGGLGKIIGPLGLALIVGSSKLITPGASVAALIPAFIFLASGYVLAGILYLFFGMETRGLTIEEIEQKLDAPSKVQAGALENVSTGSD